MLCRFDQMRCWIVCAALALGVQASAGANNEAAAPAKPVFAPGLPLKREEGNDGVGTGTAALAAGAVLLAGIWAAVQYRQRQRGGVRKPGAASVPWLGRLLPDAPGRQLRVVETAALTSHARLHVVVWQGQEYLVSTALDKVSILDRRESRAGEAMDGEKGTA